MILSSELLPLKSHRVPDLVAKEHAVGSLCAIQFSTSCKSSAAIHLSLPGRNLDSCRADPCLCFLFLTPSNSLSSTGITSSLPTAGLKSTLWSKDLEVYRWIPQSKSMGSLQWGNFLDLKSRSHLYLNF